VADNYALKFTANGQYVELGRTDAPAVWTAEFWLNKYATTNFSTLLDGQSSKIMLESWGNAYKIGLTQKGVADWAFDYVVPLNQWTHIAIVCDGTNTKLFVNGVLQDEMAHAAPLPLRSVGMETETPRVVVDEVRLWNVLRSGTEIADNMGHSLDINTPGLIGYYYYDDRKSPATDLSPEHVPGIIHGAVYVQNDNPEFTTTLSPMKAEDLTAENFNEYFLSPGSRDKDLLRINLTTSGVTEVLHITSLSVALKDAAVTGAVDSVSLYYTGADPSFSTAIPYGGRQEAVAGTITFSGDVELIPGDNYFWLACDVDAAAVTGAILDALLQQGTVGGETLTPAEGDPPGHRVVRTMIPQQPPLRTAIIPLPQEMEADTSQRFVFTAATKVTASDTLRAEAEKISAFLSRATGYPFEVISGGDPQGNISLSLLQEYNDTLGEEGYRLTVDGQGIRLAANTPAGIFYAFQTLRQLLPAAIETGGLVEEIAWDVPFVKIADWPRYSWRGMHLDVSRHFFGVDFVKEYLDIMAANKLNRFHWHLTDDQGWRIEIKSKPKLQSISAWRTCDGVKYGGYYTQEQIRDIVHYADSLHIMIIPEIELPGHTIEVLAAYPELSCTTDTSDYGGPFSVRCNAGISSHIFCAGKDATFDFLKDVLTEVAALFPGPYIHLGGDEAIKTQWEQCRDCQARMAAEGLANEQELQRWFMEQVGDFLATKNKQWIGWSEITYGGVPAGSTVMSWLGESAAVTAARAGHDAVMSPNSTLYLNKPNTDLPGEPPAQGKAPITLRQVYFYDPMPGDLSEQQQTHILGPHGCLWTEWIAEEDHAEYMILPRLMALAEIGWTAHSDDYDSFLKRVYPQYERFSLRGYNARLLVFPTAVIPERIVTCDGTDTVTLKVDVPANSYYWNDDKNTSENTLKVTESGVYKCYVDFLGDIQTVRTEVLFRSPPQRPEVDTTQTTWRAVGDADAWLWYDETGSLIAIGDTFAPPAGETVTSSYGIAGAALVNKKGAVRINGKSYARIYYDDFFDEATAFTLEGWFCIHDYSAWNRIFSKSYSNYHRVAVEMADGKLYFEVARGSNTYGKSKEQVVKKDEWHHMAFVYDGDQEGNTGRLKIYMDGEEVPLDYVGTIPDKTTNTTIPFTIGLPEQNPDFEFTEVRLWDRALSHEEVRLQRFLSLSGSEEGLVYYFQTPEGTEEQLINSSLNNNYQATLLDMSNDTRVPGYVGLMMYGCRSEIWNVGEVATYLATPRRSGSLQIAPNPNDGHFTVSVFLPGEGEAALNVYNMYGKRIYATTFSGDRIVKQLSLESLPPGTYVLEVCRDQEHYRRLFLKQ
jgi:hexosaminidase